MKDKWMNINYENDELKPYEEPSPDLNDIHRIGLLLMMNFSLNVFVFVRDNHS